MSERMTSAEIFDREFLELRAKILELAASLDRLDRGGGSVADDPRWTQLGQALEVLQAARPDRAEQVQILFSLPYDDQWENDFDLAARG